MLQNIIRTLSSKKINTLMLLITTNYNLLTASEYLNLITYSKEELLREYNEGENGDLLIKKFDYLESCLKQSENNIQDIIDFLFLYIEKVNVRFGLHLTIEEVCEIATTNLNRMNVSTETYEETTRILNALHDSKKPKNFHGKNFLKFFPWKEKGSHENKILDNQIEVHSEQITEIPGIFPFVVGLVEGAVGLAIVPFNPIAGGFLIGDGCTRVIQGIQENLQGTCETTTHNYPTTPFPE